jgi:hypothetical protein
MEPKFQTSFIPKKPVGSSQGSGIEKIQSTNIFSITATIIFIVTILVSVGLFFYKNILNNQIETANANIEAARADFEPEKIQQLLDANARILSVKNLLENHVVVSRVLVLMQDLTVKKMRFISLNYVNKNNDPTITITGEIQTYNALAEQQDAFLKNESMKNPGFSDFNLGDNGYISVNFSSKIDPGYVSYKKMLESIPLN